MESALLDYSTHALSTPIRCKEHLFSQVRGLRAEVRMSVDDELQMLLKERDG